MTPAPASPPRRILLIQKGALGDIVLATALFDDLHAAFPLAALDYGVGAAGVALAEQHPLIAECFAIDAASALSLAPSIRARGYDLVIDLQASPRTAILTRWSGAPVRVGWRQRFWSAAYTVTLERVKQQEYALRARRRLLEAAGIAVGNTAPRLVLTASEREGGRLRLASAGVPRGAKIAGLLTGTTEIAKNWPLEHFAALAAQLHAAGIAPVVFDAPGDDARIARLRTLAPAAHILPRLGLRAFLGVLAACDVLVSGDTGPAHMADALGVPRVTIFGATPSLAWTPDSPRVVALAGSRPPMNARKDRARAAGGRDDYSASVTPERVFAAVRGLIA